LARQAFLEEAACLAQALVVSSFLEEPLHLFQVQLNQLVLAVSEE